MYIYIYRSGVFDATAHAQGAPSFPAACSVSLHEWI